MLTSEKAEVIELVNRYTLKYPNVKFHLLGRIGKEMINAYPMINSSNSTTWIRSACFGKPYNVIGSKSVKAEHNMNTIKDDGIEKQLVFA